MTALFEQQVVFQPEYDKIPGHLRNMFTIVRQLVWLDELVQVCEAIERLQIEAQHIAQSALSLNKRIMQLLRVVLHTTITLTIIT